MAIHNFDDTGDAVGSGDNGGMGRPSFGGGGERADIVPHKQNAAELALGAEPLSVEVLVDGVREHMRAAGVETARIHVTRDERVITLAGEVRSEEERDVAESAARGTPGVVFVKNELVVAH